MGTVNLRHKFDLRSAKVIFSLAGMLLFFSADAQQKFNRVSNNPNYDKRTWSYGFLIGMHRSAFQAKYSEKFVTNAFDTVHSILPLYSPGFSLGFIVNRRLNDYVDARVLPKVAFYEYLLEYNYTDGVTDTKLKESTIIELPIIMKFKSARRGNARMYVAGGVKPAISAAGKAETESETKNINIQRGNISADMGVGFDLYFPLFKFSPEFRVSKGMSNMLTNKTNKYSEGLSRLNTTTFNFYLLFQ